MERYNRVISSTELTADMMRILIENTAEAAVAKGVKTIGGLPPNEWMDLLKARIGREPIFRLLYVLVRDMTVVKKNGPVVLSEVLVEDPAAWVAATKSLSLEQYWNVYPSPAMRGPAHGP